MSSNIFLSKMREGAWVFLFLGVFAGSALADPMELNADVRGWYNGFGEHFASIDSYETSWDGESGVFSTEYRSFFVFDIPVLSEAVTGATITLWSPQSAYFSPDEFETYVLWSVMTPIATLVSDQVDAVSVFEDLGAGTEFGSVDVSAADDGTYVTVTLNAAAIAAIGAQGVSGGELAIGGSVTTLSRNLGEREIVFGGTLSDIDPPATGPTAAKLTINPVPEPTVAMLIMTSAGLGFFLCRRRRAL